MDGQHGDEYEHLDQPTVLQELSGLLLLKLNLLFVSQDTVLLKLKPKVCVQCIQSLIYKLGYADVKR